MDPAAPDHVLDAEPHLDVVDKMRMSAFEGTSLETVLRSGRRDTLIITGARTSVSIEPIARTCAD